jgi:hypothetical protein
MNDQLTAFDAKADEQVVTGLLHAQTQFHRRSFLALGMKVGVATAIGTSSWLTLSQSSGATKTEGNSIVVLWNNAVLQAVRATALGPTPTSRALAIVHTCMYDAWTVYDAIAIPTLPNGIARRKGSQEEVTEAVSYAAYQALLDLFPTQSTPLSVLMTTLGYNPYDSLTNTQTPRGIGNHVARVVLDFRHRDGSNQSGGYADTSSYVPVNTPDTIVDPTRWQPLHVPDGKGDFVIQKFITPHWGKVIPFALTSGSQFRPSGPAKSAHSSLYQKQVNQILQYSATLNNKMKAIASYWANGPHTETPPGHWALFAQFVSAQNARRVPQNHKKQLRNDIILFFALSNAVFDAGIACWECKRAYDSVRPITAVHYVCNGQGVLAWGGYGRGIEWMDGANWLPYQEATVVTPPFPEYVSGHSTFSAAGAYILQQFTGHDAFNDAYTVDEGSSIIEPGITPAINVTLSWPTFSFAAEEAGLSRRYGGIHFEQGDLDGRVLGKKVAIQAWKRITALINGTVK